MPRIDRSHRPKKEYRIPTVKDWAVVAYPSNSSMHLANELWNPLIWIRTIGIGNDNQLVARLAQSSLQRRAVAAVYRMLNKRHVVLSNFFGCLVARAVIDDEDLVLDARLPHDPIELIQDGTYPVLFVISGNKDRRSELRWSWLRRDIRC